MANRQQGEVALPIGATTYILKLGTYQMGLAEDAAGEDIGGIFAKAAKGRVKHVLTLIWAALQKYHAKEFPTVESVGELIDRNGGIPSLGATLTALNATATPDPEDLKELGGPPANPPAAQAVPRRRGTGGGSTSTPGGSA